MESVKDYFSHHISGDELRAACVARAVGVLYLNARTEQARFIATAARDAITESFPEAGGEWGDDDATDRVEPPESMKTWAHELVHALVNAN